MNVACEFVNLFNIIMSIKMPEGVALTDIQAYADLLKEAGISTEIEPANIISGIIIPAKLEVRDETLESLDKKLAYQLSERINRDASAIELKEIKHNTVSEQEIFYDAELDESNTLFELYNSLKKESCKKMGR